MNIIRVVLLSACCIFSDISALGKGRDKGEGQEEVENPWEQIPVSVQVGSKVKGKVSAITDYGLFVEVQKDVEGLVHISEVSWVDCISDLKKHYAIGDTVEALVISLDKENRRMSLSIKRLE